ncbi:MAG: 4Fe-4S dicluster domain-containing protein [Ruminococcaceae bacterium]|nr:4Fe-4S dicluster domain-containing protein [Oscillospiraceae bacterium]
MAKGNVTIHEDVCKGCGLCVHACPKGVLAISKDKLNQKGYNPAEVVNADDCIGCAMCAVMCPDVAIKVER